MTYVDNPNKKQKHPHYEHRTAKLDRKDNEFTSKEFHVLRKNISTHKKILKSFGRIGMCLNDKSTGDIPTDDLDKVCFILVNDFDSDNKDKEMGVGPLNDSYLIGLNHHRLGFKVFYLYNPGNEEFSNFLKFFLKNSKIELTIFYSGCEKFTDGNEKIEFKNGCLSKDSIKSVISENSNCKAQVMFITDCIGGGSVFNIDQIKQDNEANNNSGSKMISFFVSKNSSPDSKESKRSHGIFTYYFCKIISDCPNITPSRLVERMNPSLRRFNERFRYEFSCQEISDSPIFFN